jgi:type II secretory pathway predicted ATPase ExeA
MALNAARPGNTGIPESLYLGARYAEILDFLCSPVSGSGNVKVLISAPGLGKTLLLRSAIERIKPEARTAFVFWTLLKPKDFITHLLREIGSIEPSPTDLNGAQRQFEKVLQLAAADGKRFVLAIDEAHNLSPGALKNLSALLDCDTARPPQVTVLLAGLPALHERLADPEANGVYQRIAGVMTIEPLNAEQTAHYISERISALGLGPVAPDKVANIAASSGGVLRIIDKLCHQLLLENKIRRQPGNELPAVDSPVNGSFDTREHVARVAAWVADHPGTWSGTVAELSAATGISVEEISDAVENRTQELRRAGVAAAVQRSPGKPRMISLSHVEREQAPAPSHSAIPELHENDSHAQAKREDQELETEPGLNQEPGDETLLQPTDAFGEPSAENPRTGWASRAAIVLAVIMVVALGLLYLSFPNSAHQASSVLKPVSEPRRSAEVDEVMGLRKRADAGDIVSQTALADRYREGNGVPRDDKAAMALYEQAATKGDPVAQHRLGLALSSGSEGVAADRVAAYAWLVMAQSEGQEIDQATLDSLTRSLGPDEILDVRYRLGLMYEHGIGCVPDVVLADEWFLLGAAGGDVRSRAESAALERRMSPGQISQARTRSDDWLRRHTVKVAANAAAR